MPTLLSLRAALLFWILLEVYLIVRSRARRDLVIVDRGSLPFIRVAVLTGLIAALALRGAPGPPIDGGFAGPAIRTLVLAGLAIRLYAVVTLDRFFTTLVSLQPGQTIVRRGLYRWIRHPSYLGLLMIFAGVGLASGGWVSFAALMAPTTAAFVYRMRVEEGVLAEAFGDEFAAYRRGTRRLIPYVY